MRPYGAVQKRLDPVRLGTRRRRRRTGPAETLGTLSAQRRKLLDLYYQDGIRAELFAEEEEEERAPGGSSRDRSPPPNSPPLGLVRPGPQSHDGGVRQHHLEALLSRGRCIRLHRSEVNNPRTRSAVFATGQGSEVAGPTRFAWGWAASPFPNIVRLLCPLARSALSDRPGKRRASGWGRRLEDCVRPGRRPPLPPEATKVYGRLQRSASELAKTARHRGRDASAAPRTGVCCRPVVNTLVRSAL